MPVKIKISLWFTLIAALLLAAVGSTVYYIAAGNRVSNIKTRLINRAITTARFLREGETFNEQVITKIDALTASALKQKTVQAYRPDNRRIYSFSDSYADTITVDSSIITAAIARHTSYFTAGSRDAISYYDATGNIVIVSAAYDESGNNNVQQLRKILIVVSIGGILLALISGYMFSHRLLSPVKRIADQVNEISAQNLASRIPTGDQKDEWYYLGKTLNELLNRLEDSFDSQKHFIANASHELSTPLTAISSQLEVALQKERSAAEYRQTMYSVYEDVQHLTTLTRALLEFAKAAGKSSGIELYNFRIDEVLLRLPSAEAKMNANYFVQLDFSELPEDETHLLIFGNEELVFTALKNIADNACKYSNAHQANIKLSVQGKNLKIEISDNGPGIDETELQRIFEPFYRASGARHQEGFGLGLALAMKIIKLHQGDIQVINTHAGCTFTITLPAGAHRF